tara:strand:- start:437 stop:1522 length:1086 start_codon:yes stop_codon:yes gene_type:complete
MNRILLTTAAGLLLASSCVRPAEERSKLDQEVGKASLDDLSIEVENGQAAVQRISTERITLWAQAPALQVKFSSESARDITIELFNCMPTAELQIGQAVQSPTSQPRPTHCIFDIGLPAGESLVSIAPPDWQSEESFLFADMGDIQTAMDSVDEIFDAISAEPGVRFVMSTGDVVETGAPEEYELFLEKVTHLDVPFFSTIGNHELTEDITRWHDLFGTLSTHFRFKGVDFSYVDSGNASLDPSLHSRLDRWLDEGKDRIHIFGTHYPLFDPVGVRNAGFRSRSEASKLLVQLARGQVDLTLYGHVHSLYKFENAGIPAFISGGGGALPERFDGIDRHFLLINPDPAEGRIVSIETRRIGN